MYCMGSVACTYPRSQWWGGTSAPQCAKGGQKKSDAVYMPPTPSQQHGKNYGCGTRSLKMWTPLSAWAEYCPSMIASGIERTGTSRECRGNGDGYTICYAKRGVTPSPLGGFTWWRFSLCCSLCCSCGFSSPAFYGGWGVSITGWRNGFIKGFFGVGTVTGSTPHLVRR